MKFLSLHILDLLENSLKANATMIELNIIDTLKANKYVFKIKDDGKGIQDTVLKDVSDPFVTTSSGKKMGLGLSLVKMACRRCAGDMFVNSYKGFGTDITFWFEHNNIDRQPLGDIASVVVDFAASNDKLRLIYTHITDSGSFIFDSLETKQTLEVQSLNNITIIKTLREVIENNLETINYNQ